MRMMALRILQTTFFFLLLNMLTENRIAGTTIREKCECVAVKNFVKWSHITDFKVIIPEPICNRVQIILQMQNRSLCLAPDSKQGKRLQRCWKKAKFSEKRVRACLSQKRGKQKKKLVKQ